MEKQAGSSKLGYIALSLVDGSWGVYLLDSKFHRTLVASGLSVQEAKALAAQKNN